MGGYDLVCCGKCGAAYADGIPPQDAFDRYYGEMSKYENAARLGESSPTEKARFEMVADVIEQVVAKDAVILDVGCATGGLLAELKRRNFRSLGGIDPSPTCVRLVQERHAIAARVGTMAAVRGVRPTPDVIVLIGVMEHLRDVDAAIEHVSAALARGGAIYVEVPDTLRYRGQPGAPYQLISYEHINYFSRTSLANLLARHGYREEFFEANVRSLSPTMAEPAFSVLYRREPAAADRPLVRDDAIREALSAYLEDSAQAERHVHQRIAQLVESGRPLAVWGTGTHTLRLLETSRLADANLVAFIDSNPRYQGKTLRGRPVVSSAAFDPSAVEILISSPAAEDEIHRVIREKLGWTCPVHRLYGSSIGEDGIGR